MLTEGLGGLLSRWFCHERTMMVLILLNGIVITLSYFPLLEGHAVLHGLDRLFTLLFIVEAALKIGTWGPQAYFSRSWNRFDFILTALGVPSLFQELVPLPDMSFWLVQTFFATVLLFGGVLGLSLANAVFVGEMTIDNTASLERKVDTLQQRFDDLLAALEKDRRR